MINWRLLLVGIVIFWGWVILAYKGVEPFRTAAMIGYQLFKVDTLNENVDTSKFPLPRTEQWDKIKKEPIDN